MSDVIPVGKNGDLCIDSEDFQILDHHAYPRPFDADRADTQVLALVYEGLLEPFAHDQLILSAKGRQAWRGWLNKLDERKAAYVHEALF